VKTLSCKTQISTTDVEARKFLTNFNCRPKVKYLVAHISRPRRRTLPIKMVDVDWWILIAAVLIAFTALIIIVYVLFKVIKCSYYVTSFHLIRRTIK
jgi:hypothetical protein